MFPPRRVQVRVGLIGNMRVLTPAVAAAVAAAGFSLVFVDGFIKPSPMSGGGVTLSRARSLSKPALSVTTQPETEENLREKLADRNEDLSEVRIVAREI